MIANNKHAFQTKRQTTKQSITKKKNQINLAFKKSKNKKYEEKTSKFD